MWITINKYLPEYFFPEHGIACNWNINRYFWAFLLVDDYANDYNNFKTHTNFNFIYPKIIRNKAIYLISG
jgi:hypothetical protein